MVASLLSSLAGFWKMDLSTGAIFLLSVATVALAWVLWRSPWAALGMLSAAAIGSVGGWYYVPKWAAWLAATHREWLQFWDHLRVFDLNTTFGPNVGLVFLVVAGLGMSMLIVLESLTEGTTFWSITGGAAIFASQWLWYYDRSATAFMAYGTFAFALWILAQAARRDAAWASSGRRIGYRSHVLTPVAWVLAASILAAVLPTDFSAMNLGVVGDKFVEIFPVFKQLRGSASGLGTGRFSLRSTGFSPNIGSLGGPVKLDNSLAMRLTMDTPLRDTAYLRGASFYTYNGQTWLTQEPQTINVPPGGDLPTSFGPDVLRDYIKFSITPEINLGGTIFSMLEPMRVDNLKTEYQTDTDGNIWTDRNIAKGTTYQVNARVPRYSAEQIVKLTTPEPDSLKPYRQVPATMPRRVGETARSIAAGKESPYEKAVAIESYLRGMKYDLDVPVPPSGRDFVDYFLFDLKKGYCTYYATAMSVMLRELEIPTRLVEGFAVPASTKSTLNADGKYDYEVRNTQAHAWVEAYFPGYGWATFDPTPRTDLPLIDRSTPAPEASGITPGTGENETPDTDPNANNAPKQTPNQNDPSAGDEIAPVAAQTREWPWALIAVVAVAAVVVAGLRRMQSSDRIKATVGREVVQEAWDKTGSLMSRFSFGRRPDHTAQEYARQIGQDWPSLQEPAKQVANDYTVARYAPPGRPTDPEAASRAKEFWNTVRESLISRYGWRTYLWNRIKLTGVKLGWPSKKKKAS